MYKLLVHYYTWRTPYMYKLLILTLSLGGHDPRAPDVDERVVHDVRVLRAEVGELVEVLSTNKQTRNMSIAYASQLT